MGPPLNGGAGPGGAAASSASSATSAAQLAAAAGLRRGHVAEWESMRSPQRPVRSAIPGVAAGGVAGTAHTVAARGGSSSPPPPPPPLPAAPQPPRDAAPSTLNGWHASAPAVSRPSRISVPVCTMAASDASHPGVAAAACVPSAGASFTTGGSSGGSPSGGCGTGNTTPASAPQMSPTAAVEVHSAGLLGVRPLVSGRFWVSASGDSGGSGGAGVGGCAPSVGSSVAGDDGGARIGISISLSASGGADKLPDDSDSPYGSSGGRYV